MTSTRVSKTTTSKKIKALARKVNAVIPAKNKYFQSNYASTNAASSPDVTGAVGYDVICRPTQGDSILQRTGDRIRMNSCKFVITLQKTDQALYRSYVRMIIIYDHENSFSNMDQLLTDTVSDGGIYADLLSTERPRYTLIKDVLFKWPPNTYSIAGGVLPTQTRTFRFNLKRKLATFTPGGSAVYHGAFKVFFLSPDSAGNGTTRINWNATTWFNDVL